MKIPCKRKSIVIQRDTYNFLNSSDWSTVLYAIITAKDICEYWLQHPNQYNSKAAAAFNRRNVPLRTYIPQLIKIYNVLKNLGYANFRKDNSGDYCAMVYPTDLNHIIILGADFWTAPNEGRDSKPGILIHEITHFVDVIGTDDYAYGDDADVQSLFGLSSTLGGNNADTWEHFIEF